MLACVRARRNVNRNQEWRLRNACLDFITACTLTRDEAGLTWLLQRTVTALRELVAPEMIVQRVKDSLPKGEDGGVK